VPEWLPVQPETLGRSDPDVHLLHHPPDDRTQRHARYMFGLYPTLLAIVLLAHRWPAIRPAVLCISGMVASFIAVAFVNFKFFTV
jgi:hypothetical protein